MKYIYYFLTLTFILQTSTDVLAQGTSCADADPFCTGTTYSFPNNTGTYEGRTSTLTGLSLVYSGDSKTSIF